MTRGGATEMVAVLITDMVRSTELMSELGAPIFDALRRAHFAAVREAIEANNGRQVKTLGDGVLATFNSATDAVACAVGVQRAADRQARTQPVALAIRVGLAVGDVSFEERDVFGTAVVEASRLVSAACPGQVLATAVVPMITGGRSSARFTDVGLMELKGLPDPVAVCEVGWDPARLSAVALPELLRPSGLDFVGREDELEHLGRLWKEVSTGERRLALVRGEPGIGKTRLAAELAQRVHPDGATVLAGGCDEDLGMPYQPFVEALRHFVRGLPDLAGRLGRHAAELVRLVPEISQALPGLPPPLRSDPETERYRLFDAVAAWLAAASVHEPVLLVLDDLQWAAKPTLLLLRHVVRSSEPMRLLVLATYRDTELGRTHPSSELLAELQRAPVAARIRLSGLDRSAVAALLERAAGDDVATDDDALARAIHLETEGNPFFVGEVLRHLIETGGVRREAGRWVTAGSVEDLGIPEGVRDVVGRRLARLSEDANRVLALAAVVGQEFDLAVVQAAGDFDEDTVLSAVEEAVAAGLLDEVPGPIARHRFSHALMRFTLYEELSGARRATFHRRVAEAIESVHGGRLDDHIPALAHHYARATSPVAEAGKAIAYARRAGDRALSLLAHDEAVAYYRRALEIFEMAEQPPEEDQRLELLTSLGEAECRAGDPSHRATLLKAAGLARARGAAPVLARAALANSRGMFSLTGGVDEERVSTLETALAALGNREPHLRARLLANLSLELTWLPDRERRQRLADEALTIARRLGDPATTALALIARSTALCDPSTLPERLDATAELLTIVEQIGDPLLAFRAHYRRAIALTELGEMEAADASRASAERLAADLGQPVLRWYVAFARATRLLMAGRIDEAEREARRAFELGRATSQPDALVFFVVQLFFIRFDQGRLAEMEEQVRSVADAISLPETQCVIHCLLALLYCEVGRDDDARAVFDDVAAVGFSAFPLNSAWMLSMTSGAAACEHLGDRAQAAVLRELLLPFADRVASDPVAWLGSVGYYLALLDATLDHFEEAEARFAAAATTHARLGAPVWLARTRLEWARMLLRRDGPEDTDRARDLLAEVRPVARRLRLDAIDARASALLPSNAR